MIQTKSSKRRIRRKKINKIETLTEIMEKIEGSSDGVKLVVFIKTEMSCFV